MRVVLLGTGGHFPTPRRQTTCVFLPEHGVIIDAGSGISRLHGMTLPPHLDIFLTHGHIDHTMGLTWLPGMFERGDVNSVTLWAAGSLAAEVVARLFAEPMFPRGWPELSFQTQTRTLTPKVELPELLIETKQVPHRSCGATARRLTDRAGDSVVGLADTCVTGEHAGFCREAGLLLADSFFRSSQESMARRASHGTPMGAALLACESEARRLGLIHINPMEPNPAQLVEEAREIFPNTFLGEDNLDLSISLEPVLL